MVVVWRAASCSGTFLDHVQQSTLFTLVARARRFFSPGAAAEIYSLLRPALVAGDPQAPTTQVGLGPAPCLQHINMMAFSSDPTSRFIIIVQMLSDLQEGQRQSSGMFQGFIATLCSINHLKCLLQGQCVVLQDALTPFVLFVLL